METKFTKGPWVVQSTEKAHMPGHFWHEIAADGVVFGEIYEPEADEEPRDALADANLIASTPDLYGALATVLAYRNGEKPFDFHRIADQEERGNAAFDGWEQVEQKVRAALAKARGEQL